MRKFKLYLKIIRIRQWIKNLFVVAPLLFSGKFISLENWYNTIVATIVFCIASSIIYIYNDIKDIDFDKAHLTKRFTRPLASGELSISEAFILLLFLFSLIASILYFVANKELFIIIGLYLLTNYFYTNWTKNIPIIDLFSISFGFVLRLLAGSYAINSNYSEWMIVTTVSISLFLGSIKRLQELRKIEKDLTIGTRSVLSSYSVPLLEKLALISSISCLIYYSIFTLIINHNLILTIPFIIYGVFRYWYLVEMRDDGESPTDVVLNDTHIMITIFAWAVTVGILII